MMFSSSVSLMISCLVIESVAERGVLKSPTQIVDLFIFFFSNVISFCFRDFETLLFGAYI